MSITKNTPQINKNANVIPLAQGQLPPQAIEIEEAVISGILIDRTGFERVNEIIDSDMFYKEEHQMIFQAATTLYQTKNSVVDLRTVTEQLVEDNNINRVGGGSYLIKMSQSITSAAHIEYHARIIQEKFILRSLIEVSSKIIQKSYDETQDVFDTIQFAETQIYNATENKIKIHPVRARDLIGKLAEQIQKIQSKGGYTGVESGFQMFDQITSGFQPSDLIVLAARPGMGKTALMLSMARNMAIMSQKTLAIFSLEMSAMQLITRMVSAETGIPFAKVRDGGLTPEDFGEVLSTTNSLGRAPIFIDETPQLSIYELRSKARRLKTAHDIDIILIDYLQLMTVSDRGRNQNREQTISQISSTIKALAKELNIPIVALSQLNRAVEKREKYRPQLSDLRESGAIEQDADIVAFLYRPRLYGIETWDDGSSTENEAEIIISKHRNGTLDSFRIGFNGEISKFSDDRIQHQFKRTTNPQKIPSKMNDSKTSMDENPMPLQNDDSIVDEDVPQKNQTKSKNESDEPF
ncbi:MAG: replicative DNA helicase [Flavobacteriaceae bacterium]|nr:replicative DNA helicase [Flavobacteriaceae bacterium]MCY4266687.1 replicative DNA helicase [Flavobacteriaceae bacterium]MCY4299726.1 replicative DNA helicase [Flavobacteriaceae bacterium]